MPVHAVGVLPEKIFLFYIGSIADNNQKMKERRNMKGRTEEGKKSKQTVGCNFKSLNLPMWTTCPRTRLSFEEIEKLEHSLSCGDRNISVIAGQRNLH